MKNTQTENEHQPIIDEIIKLLPEVNFERLEFVYYFLLESRNRG